MEKRTWKAPRELIAGILVTIGIKLQTPAVKQQMLKLHLYSHKR